MFSNDGFLPSEVTNWHERKLNDNLITETKKTLICQVMLGRTGLGNISANCQMTNSIFSPPCVDDESVNEYVYVCM